MRFRVKRKKQRPLLGRRRAVRPYQGCSRSVLPSSGRSRFVLESLDPRLLLSVTNQLFDAINEGMGFDDFIRPGYGIPDAYYSDPATWSMLEQDIFSSYDMDFLTSGDDTDPLNLLDYNSPEAAAAAGSSVLYLDFDGERVYSRAGDFWLGDSYVDIPDYDLTMFGWDGLEQESIQYISQFVQEDYAAYNVYVTTTKPASGEYSTIYVGGNNDWFRPGSGVIGVATYDIDNRDPSNYGFAFPEELDIYKNYSGGSLLHFSEYLANLITHEAAHTFGANHVSDTSAIMNPYLPLSPRTLSFGSDDGQDTQTMLGDNLGYRYSPDDYGDDKNTAQGINSNTTIAGLLERRDDVDAFTFTATANGTVTLDLDTSEFGNLDSTLAVLRNSDLAVIAQNDDYLGQDDSFLTFAVNIGQQYTIKVAGSGQSSSGSYALNVSSSAAPPTILVTDSSGQVDDLAVDFGTVTVGHPSTANITISNTGAENLVISELFVGGVFNPDQISLAGNDQDDIIITPGSSLQFGITCSADSIGSQSGLLTIVCNDPEQEQLTLMLTAEAQAPQPELVILVEGIEINGDEVSFGDVMRNELGSETITFRNDGLAPLEITNINISAPFALEDDFGETIVLYPDQSMDWNIQVSSAQRGSLDGWCSITSNDPEQVSTTLSLNAQIVGGVLTAYDSYSDNEDHFIDFGSVFLGEQVNQTLTLVNTGDAELKITGLSADGSFTLDYVLNPDLPADDISLAVGESLQVVVGYAPNNCQEVTGYITIVTNDNELPLTIVDLQAMGQSGALESVPLGQAVGGSIDLGEISLADNQQQIPVWQVTNHGNEPLTISLTLDEAAGFQTIGPNTIILEAEETYTISITFSSNLAREVSGSLTFTVDDFDQSTETISLSANPYALVGRGRNYSFSDNSGDRVIVSLSGGAWAKIHLGEADQPDIESIQFITAAEAGFEDQSGTMTAGFLNIIVTGGGTTEIGLLTGQADLSFLNAPQVNVVAAGIDLQGAIDFLRLNSLTEGAQLNFASRSPAFIMMGHISDDSSINVDGPVRIFLANDFAGGALSTDNISIMLLDRLAADVEVTQGSLDNLIVRQGDLGGNINVNGSLGTVLVLQGDLLGNIQAESDISRILLPRGTITGSIKSGRDIGNILANDFDRARLFAQRHIERINVLGDVSDSLISIGYDPAQMSQGDSWSSAETDASLGTLQIGGTFNGSNVAVGIAPDIDGNFLNGSSYNTTGTIGSVTISRVITDNQTLPFGVMAKDSLSRVNIENQLIPTDYHQDDFYITVMNK